MKATEAKLLNFLNRSPQFIIPIYQRTYSWTENECRKLWDDIIRVGRDDKVDAHFIGSVVYIEQGLYQVMNQPPLLVIDGQQRLTTLSLLIEALARRVGDTEPVSGFSQKKLREYYLLNMLEDGDRRYKLLLTQTDRESLLALVTQKQTPVEFSQQVEENFVLFMELIATLNGDLVPLCKGLSKLMLVDIALSRDQDNPQLIFESMNSTGRELTQADLIRNYILMGLEPDHQSRLYKDHWRPIETAFGQDAYGKHFDRFVRDYLTLKTGAIARVGDVYEAFKLYTRRPDVAKNGVDKLVADLQTYAGYYRAMAIGHEKDPLLAEAFRDLRELNVDVVYPFLMRVYHDHRCDYLDKGTFAQVVRCVESYLFRRSVCNAATNSLSKTFADFPAELDVDRYPECVLVYLVTRKSYRRFPPDSEFIKDFKQRNLYNFRSRSYWLRRMENHQRKERVAVEEYTIEHILPQNEDLNAQWRADLGVNWQEIQATWLHTAGNLTLTGYNSEYSDKSFTDKRDMEGGFKTSPLRLNEGLGQQETWDAEAITERAERLAKKAVDVWPMPKVSAETIASFKPVPSVEGESYTIEDHPYLSQGSEMYGTIPKELFTQLRKEILAIDPCVHEVVLKNYVAYKAETNFVDIIPKAKGLRLTLNMKFPDLNDPKSRAEDVSDKGRWGNGEVSVFLLKASDIPYVMGLIRQSFDRQMGNGGDGI